jgi:hypothetical protein
VRKIRVFELSILVGPNVSLIISSRIRKGQRPSKL